MVLKSHVEVTWCVYHMVFTTCFVARCGHAMWFYDTMSRYREKLLLDSQQLLLTDAARELLGDDSLHSEATATDMSTDSNCHVDIVVMR